MTRAQKKKFYVAFALVIVVVFGVGILAGYIQRNGGQHCPDGKAPIAQQVDATLGQTMYLCDDGTIVTVAP